MLARQYQSMYQVRLFTRYVLSASGRPDLLAQRYPSVLERNPILRILIDVAASLRMLAPIFIFTNRV